MGRIALDLSARHITFLSYPRASCRRLLDTLPPFSENQLFGKSSVRRPLRRRSLTSIVAALIVLFVVIHGTIRNIAQGFSPHWLKYPVLGGYFHGLDSIVSSANYTPEYPDFAHGRSIGSVSSTTSAAPMSSPRLFPFQPYLDSTEETGGRYGSMKPCYLDAAETIEAPDIYAYNGIPQLQPLPAMGSHSVLNLRDNICFDRYGRYGPYGFGYSLNEDGRDEGISNKSDPGMAPIWLKSGYIDYRNVDWGKAQDRCFKSNLQQFVTRNDTVTLGKKHRQAIVIRTYTGFMWTEYAKLNIRALISETSLKSGGEYGVHLLLHVKDDGIAIFTDMEARQRVLEEHVPKEFHSICTLWSEAQMRLYYPGDFGVSVENPSGRDIHGVYRSGHMALQHFAVHHPEYAHFWNWELDIRYIGSYYELFSRIGNWAAKQPRILAWEQSARYYIPALHGSWENYTMTIKRNSQISGHQPIMGPTKFAGNQTVGPVEEDYFPESCKNDSNASLCGVDEPADLITLNPIFDVENSGWVFSKDVTGYDVKSPLPPRRSTIVTASRLSWRLLNHMHQETWRLRHSMFTEMFAPSIALHYGLKAVFAPHPVYLERSWPLESVENVFNGGTNHTSSGLGSPFAFENEHNFKGTTWYYHAEFAGRLWRRWLDRSEEGDEKQEKHAKTEGQTHLCLRSMLFHPIKWE